MKLRRNLRRKQRETEMCMEEEPSNTEEDDLRWCHWTPPCTLQFEVHVHGKVVRPKRPA
jgi:hypothetical protein